MTAIKAREALWWHTVLSSGFGLYGKTKEEKRQLLNDWRKEASFDTDRGENKVTLTFDVDESLPPVELADGWMGVETDEEVLRQIPGYKPKIISVDGTEN